jgi:2-keto-4-pentenoate hydratase
MQKMLNVDQPDYGHILDGMVLQDGAQFRVAELIQPKIEPEIAFIMDRDLKGPGVTPMQVMAATRFVVPALEIIDSRIEGWKIKLCDTIADNASSARVVLGSSPRRVDERDLKNGQHDFGKNGDIVQTGAGGRCSVIPPSRWRGWPALWANSASVSTPAISSCRARCAARSTSRRASAASVLRRSGHYQCALCGGNNHGTHPRRNFRVG